MKPKSKIASFFYALFIDFHHFKFIERIENVVARMRQTEKILFYTVSVIFAVSSIIIVFRLNSSLLVEVPAFGGKFSEGLIGSPRFINPVLAISDTDKDLTSIIYSGLLKPSENSDYEPDLASRYEIKENGTVYEFILKENAYFHDGKKVTADDVVFTISKALDPVIKSPRKANWEGVVVEKINDSQVRFTLQKPYAPFMSALTLGILPKHIWENASSEEFPFSEFNINPVGSGPYKIEKITRNSGGIPTVMTLSSWKKYASGRPKVKTITFKFYQNENDLIKAYNEKTVENTAGLSATSTKKISLEGSLVEEASLPRVFGVFLNQNAAPVFLNREIREALNMATPKQKIVDEVLSGSGSVLNGPTPRYVEEDPAKTAGNIDEALSLLSEAGWKENENGILEKKTKNEKTEFAFSITTSDAPELRKTAEMLKEAWEQLGASVAIKVFESGDLNQNVIRPRKYDALLFGEVVGENSDLFPFWHSSERNDPGLNISMYANITVDKMLDEMRAETDEEAKLAKKDVVVAEIRKDMPAIFLFSPHFQYIRTSKIKNVAMGEVSSLNERFNNINNWFIETDKVWEFFAPEQ